MTDFAAYSLDELQSLVQDLHKELADCLDAQPENSYAADCLRDEINAAELAIWDLQH